MRIIVMFAVYGSLVLINIRGVRQGAGAVTVITVAKLLPLLLFICVGIFFIHTPNLAWSGWPSSKSLGDAVILLIFAFVGIEVALIPSGEVKNPARTVPRSAYLALVITTIIYLMIQLVAQGTLGPDLANHPDAPLAESAATFLGNLGRMILLAGASISAFGFVTSDILSSPRMIFAFGRDGALPQFFAHVHPRYRSPDVAIITYAVLAFALSISGTFERLAVLSNVAVLLMYLLCCAACWVLVQRDVRSDGKPFNFPGMKVVPALAILAIVWILAHATVREFLVTGIVLALSSVFYFGAFAVSPESVGKRQKPISFSAMRDNYLEEYYSFLRFPSVSTDDQYKEELAECANWLVNKLNRIGLQTQLVPTKRHPIVWARNEHRAGRPTVMIYGHYDVQPPDPLELWDSPPFEPVLKNGYVFAPGIDGQQGSNPCAHSRDSGND